MSARQYVTIWCDGRVDGNDCGVFWSHSNCSATEARHSAQRSGWVRRVINHQAVDLCPLHAEGRNDA